LWYFNDFLCCFCCCFCFCFHVYQILDKGKLRLRMVCTELKIF
jgi:hypothetical protein